MLQTSTVAATGLLLLSTFPFTLQVAWSSISAAQTTLGASQPLTHRLHGSVCFELSQI